MNKVTLVGRVSADATVKNAGSKEIAEFNMATDKYKSEKPDYHRIKFWEPKGVAGFLKKGTWVAVDGRIETRSYDTEQGTRWITEIIVNRLELVGGRPQQNNPAPANNNNMSNGHDDDYVPF